MTIGKKGTRAASRPARAGGVDRRRRYAVVMAGGIGTRFWPWSRESSPKQLLALASTESMLVDTIARLDKLVPAENILVVTARRHRRQVLAESPSLLPANVLGEPVGRNTAPCIGWATLEVLQRCPDAVTAVLSADHVLGGSKAFASDFEKAFRLADRHERLVTFGIPPTGPATGYGYLKMGRRLDDGGPGHEVEAFVEKPNLATARRYVASGKYFWNSGMFVWRADAMWRELSAHMPELASGLEAMNRGRRGKSIASTALDRFWPRLPSVSIDYGVLEKSRHVAMLPASFTWTDIGSWDAAASVWPTDANGNASRDVLLAIDAASNVVATRGKPVALLGVEGLVVVDAGDVLLVCSRERCQDVRGLVAKLEATGLGRLK